MIDYMGYEDLVRSYFGRIDLVRYVNLNYL